MTLILASFDGVASAADEIETEIKTSCLCGDSNPDLSQHLDQLGRFNPLDESEALNLRPSTGQANQGM